MNSHSNHLLICHLWTSESKHILSNTDFADFSHFSDSVFSEKGDMIGHQNLPTPNISMLCLKGRWSNHLNIDMDNYYFNKYHKIEQENMT